MSGKSGASFLLDGLPDAIARVGGVDIVVPAELTEHARLLLVALGVRYTVASGPGRRVPPMPAIAPAELDTQDCNEYGCVEPATGGRGPDRNKCERHKREANGRRAAANRARSGEFRKSNPVAHPRTSGAKPTVEPKKREEQSLQGLARDLVPAAAALERKLGARKTARVEAQAAMDEFKARLDALAQAVRALVA